MHQINTCTNSEIARQAVADTLLHGDPILNQYNPQARLQELREGAGSGYGGDGGGAGMGAGGDG